MPSVFSGIEENENLQTEKVGHPVLSARTGGLHPGKPRLRQIGTPRPFAFQDEVLEVSETFVDLTNFCKIYSPSSVYNLIAADRATTNRV